jgi:hypothetical protein
VCPRPSTDNPAAGNNYLLTRTVTPIDIESKTVPLKCTVPAERDRFQE